jgi:hypothetical protein
MDSDCSTTVWSVTAVMLTDRQTDRQSAHLLAAALSVSTDEITGGRIYKRMHFLTNLT